METKLKYQEDWDATIWYLDFYKRQLNKIHLRCPQKDWTEKDHVDAEYWRKQLRELAEWRYAILKEYE